MRQARTGWCLVAVASVALLSCSRHPPTAPLPGAYSITGHVRLTGYLVDDGGEPAGTRVVEDADSVLVELLYGDRIVARTTTVDGVYRFSSIRPGAYRARCPVIDEIGDATERITVANDDLVVDDVIDVKARGDLVPVPNPGIPPITVWFDLADSGRVEADVLSMSGRLVRHVYANDMPAGWRALAWVGHDQYGRPATDPIYWMTLRSPTDVRAHLLFRSSAGAPGF